MKTSMCVCVCVDQETPPDLPDESTMWGARYNSLNSLAACPNSTTDFAMLAQFVSTPFTHKTPFSSNLYQDKGTHTHTHLGLTCILSDTAVRFRKTFYFSPENNGDADDEAFIRRQPKKLR